MLNGHLIGLFREIGVLMDNMFFDDIIEKIKMLEGEVTKVRKGITDLQDRSIIVGNNYRKDIKKLQWKEVKLKKKIEDLKRLV